MTALRWSTDGRDWPNAASSRFVDGGELKWHVQVMGNGPVLLLLHGTAASTHSWRDLAPLLAEHFTVVAPDLPGHGFTSALKRPNLPAVSRALSALMTALDLQPAIIAGHSAGAAIAVTMADLGLAKPQALISLCGALLPFADMAGKLFPAMARILFDNPITPSLFAFGARQPGMIGSFLPRSTGSRVDPIGMALYARLMANSGHVHGALALMAHWDLVPVERGLAGLQTPVLLIHGERDATVPASTSRQVAAKLPLPTLMLLPKLGHLAHEEAPAEHAALIIDFARAAGVLAGAA